MPALSETAAAAFVRGQTAVAVPPLVPEIRLHLATEITPLWQASEALLERHGVAPPFWAFAWVGGQALARHVLDTPEAVRGRTVLDFGTGGGLVAIAAAMAGAAAVLAADIDPVAVVAARLNAALNGVELEARVLDPTAGPCTAEIVLVGDVCYERTDAARIVDWLSAAASGGALVLLGDPGRTFLPQERLHRIATHAVPTTLELEDRTERETGVWRLAP